LKDLQESKDQGVQAHKERKAYGSHEKDWQKSKNNGMNVRNDKGLRKKTMNTAVHAQKNKMFLEIILDR